LKELEAEAVAMICCSALNLPGIDSARSYIQNWWGAGHPIPEKSVHRILKAGAAPTQAGDAALS
jgi:hypothetical protein